MFATIMQLFPAGFVYVNILYLGQVINHFVGYCNINLRFCSRAPQENVNADPNIKPAKKRKARAVSTISCNGIEEDHDSEINVKIEKDQSTESLIRKMVKLEPESDCDVPKKKKKHKHIELNGFQNDLQDSYDESHLDLQVKQEQLSVQLSKKKRRQSIIEPDDTENVEESKYGNNSDICEETVKHKKKKKKSKKRNDSEGQDAMDIDYKEDIVETVVNKSSSKINRSTEKSYMESSSILQDESGCEEISAIQCDGDTDTHTISFNDSQNKVGKENKKKTDTLLKSTIVNQFKMANDNVDFDSSQETGKRVPRISDRIRFEDEDDPILEYSDTQESKQEKESKKLKKFIKSQDNIKIVSQELEHDSILTEDDEIWVVKCPKEVDIQAFCDTDLNLNVSKCKIKVDGQTYEGSLEEGQCDTIAALSMENGHFEVQNLPLCGIINFRKRIPKPHFRDDNIMVNNQTNFIPLPDTKCRHPLFGSNYKKAIKVPSAVAERLNTETNVEETVNISKKKKKKHKKDKSSLECDEADTKSVCVMKSEPNVYQEVPEKKKKKRKHTEDVDVVDAPAPKKAKRIKHDPESAEAWESEKAIEENLFNF